MQDKILGFYEKFMIVERGEICFVTNRSERKILFKGSKEEAKKYFVMIIANFINEKGEVNEA